MKTALITGSSSGFGKATAQLFLNNGWNVVATMRQPQDGLFNASSNNLRVIALDVTDAESVRVAVSEALGAFGGVDALVNNAGFGVFSPLETTSDELTRRLFQTNTLGTIAMARSIVPHMRQRGSGTIVNVTSSVVFNPAPLVSVYAATKTAVEGFSEALYHELAPFGIRVKLVEPGYGPDTRFRANMMAFNDANSFSGALPAAIERADEQSTRIHNGSRRCRKRSLLGSQRYRRNPPIPSRGRFNGQHEDASWTERR